MKQKLLPKWPVMVVLAMLIWADHAPAYYDPGVQRWINRDPIGESGGLNKFGFVRNSPAGAFDVFGHSWASKCAGLVCASVIAKDTEGQLREAGIRDRDNREGGNAFLHCVIACRIKKKCNDAGVRHWDQRENRATAAGRQDHLNNQVGFSAAEDNKHCWDSCMKEWLDGNLFCEGGTTECPPPPRVISEPTVPSPIPGAPSIRHP
jgi:hypothetical protein